MGRIQALDVRAHLPHSAREHLEKIRKDIRDFKAANGLDKVIVLWTANTERFSSIIPGVNTTADEVCGHVLLSRGLL